MASTRSCRISRSSILGFLLTRCPNERQSLNIGRSIHAFLLKQPDSSWWVDGDVILHNHLLNFYVKFKNMKMAQNLFDQMPKRNIVTWSSLISAYDQCGKSERALEMFSLMVSYENSAYSSSSPNEFTYASAINACKNQEHLIQGMQIHSHALQRGYVSHLKVSNVLISLYMTFGNVTEAQLIFQEIPVPDQVSWNSMVSGLSQNGFSQAALQTFQRMRGFGSEITSFALSAAVSACSEDESDGKRLHGLAIKINLNAEAFIGCAMTRMYSKFKNMDDAVKAFEELSSKDVVSWNSLIEGYAESDHAEMGLQVFYDFMKSELESDDITITAVMGICTNLVMLDYGKQVHALTVKTGLDSRIRVGNSLIDMYSKCGSLEDGIKAFRFIEEKTLVSWTALIGGLALHGKATEAIELFEKMKRDGLKPNKVTYTCILNACRHGGQVGLGQTVFNLIEKPESEHLICMVHILSGGGRFEEAEEFIQRSPTEHQDLLWQNFLVACKNSGECERGIDIVKKILKTNIFENMSSEFFTAALYVCAAAERRDLVEDLRKIMKENGIKKGTGYSWI